MNNPAYDRTWLAQRLPSSPMLGPCAKQVVVATVKTPDGRTFTGTNSCRNPQPVCPRVLAGHKTGEGYELCVTVCQQTAHAEANALAQAKEHARGATLFVEGHTYACRTCKGMAKVFGIADLVVGGGFVRLNP